MNRKAKHLATKDVKELENMINRFCELNKSPRVVNVFYTPDDFYYHAFLEYENGHGQ